MTTPSPSQFAGSRKPEPLKPVKRPKRPRLSSHADEETLRKLKAMKGKR